MASHASSTFEAAQHSKEWGKSAANSWWAMPCVWGLGAGLRVYRAGGLAPICPKPHRGGAYRLISNLNFQKMKALTLGPPEFQG